MPTLFDKLTEGDRERELMEAVRGGRVRPEEMERHSLPFFIKLQIQTLSPCNASCVMCPWPQVRDELPQGAMSEETYRLVVDQMAGRGVERTSLFLMNEPLLDRRLEHFTRILKEKEPRTGAVIFTNGALLDGRRVEGLAAAGMDEVVVSVVGFTAESYARNMGGLDYARLLANLKEVREAADRGRLGRMALKVVSLEMPGASEGVAGFEAATGWKPYFKPVTNRAGSIDTGSLGAPADPSLPRQACQRPFVKGFVLYDGGMVLCECDWRRTTIMGNVHQTTLEEMWRGAKLMEIRRNHVRGTYPAASPCAKCDYPALL